MITSHRWFRPFTVNDLRWRMMLVAAIFLLSVMIKLWAVSPFTSPNVLGDDVVYLDIARSLHDHLAYPSFVVFPKYPPLYPLLISMALTDGNEYFAWIKVLNVVLSSSLLVVTYFLSSLFLGARGSILSMVLAFLLPYHFTNPQFLLSENLFYPLVVFSIACFVMANEKNATRWSLLFGVTVALSCLTRYITIALIPLFMLFWFTGASNVASEVQGFWRQDLRAKIRLFGFVAASFLVCYAPWLIGGLLRGWGIPSILGFGVVSAKPEITFHASLFDSIAALAQWLRLYLSYTFLMVGPCLGILLSVVIYRPKEFFGTREGKFFVLSMAIVLGLVVTSAHHSWGAHYNYPFPRYLVGRYLMPVGVLLAVNSIIVFKFLGKGLLRRRSLWMSVALSTSVIVFSYFGLLTDTLGFIHKGFLVNTDSGDINIYRLTGLVGLGWVLAANMTLTMSADRSTRRKLLQTGLVMTILVLVFNSLVTYYILAFRQNWMEHGEKLVRALGEARVGASGQVLVINNDVPDLSEDQLRATLAFRGLSGDHMMLVNTEHISDSTLRFGEGVLLTEKRLPEDTRSHQMAEYEIYGSSYRIYDLPMEINTSAGIELLGTTIEEPQVELFEGAARFLADAISGRILDKVSPRYGTNINTWNFFRDVVLLQYLHVFPDRTLRLMVKGTNLSKGSLIVWDGKRLKTYYRNSQELWAVLPHELYTEGHDHTLLVRCFLGSLAFSSPIINIQERGFGEASHPNTMLQ